MAFSKENYPLQAVRGAACGLFGVAALMLGGCTIAGGGLEDMIDHSTITSSIARPAKVPPPAGDADQLSDGNTVRNAVSAAKLGSGMEPLPWANAQTGAFGTITAISEVRTGPAICRSFTTSRQRFDGIALYSGQACTAGAGDWVLTQFSEAG
ncbi:RT0821/Lpp0805 family surface protein [Aureimonas fodinaquatilis]|uniref:RT0821/Lpp0805 family surface protein n=1 Tax=Aureimonas fodinaquatilis TaxID=2565783 RepID=UPI00165D73D6|nr:RT0821/Lpp0805 family surface protein [Aureimonas fodinaquatilis]